MISTCRKHLSIFADPRADKSILDKGELEALALLDSDIRRYDEGRAEEAELPF